MARWNALTEENKKDIFEMMDSGMTSREIADLIGVKQGTIYNYRKAWKKQRAKTKPEVIEEPETKKEEVSTGLADSDYAKAYLANDSRWANGSLDISRTVKIRSRKTEILYEMDGSDDEKIVKITLNDGQEIRINLKMFEKFIDEGVDVFLEFKRTA